MQKRDMLEHEKEILNIELTDKDAIIIQKDNEIGIYTQELEQNKEHADQLTKELDESLLRFK